MKKLLLTAMISASLLMTGCMYPSNVNGMGMGDPNAKMHIGPSSIPM